MATAMIDPVTALEHLRVLCGIPEQAIQPLGTTTDAAKQRWAIFKRPGNLLKGTKLRVQIAVPEGLSSQGKFRLDEKNLALPMDDSCPFIIVWLLGMDTPADVEFRPLSAVEAVYIDLDGIQCRTLYKLAHALRAMERALVEYLGLTHHREKLLSQERDAEFLAHMAILDRSAELDVRDAALEFAPLTEEEVAALLDLKGLTLEARVLTGQLARVGSGITGEDLIPKVITLTQAAAELQMPEAKAREYLARRSVEPFSRGLWPAHPVGILAARRRFKKMRTDEQVMTLEQGLHLFRETLAGKEPELIQDLINRLMNEGFLIWFQVDGREQRYVLESHLRGVLALLTYPEKILDFEDLRTAIVPYRVILDLLVIPYETLEILTRSGILPSRKDASHELRIGFGDAAELLLSPSVLRA